jgi:hypothetical protein
MSQPLVRYEVSFPIYNYKEYERHGEILHHIQRIDHTLYALSLKDSCDILGMEETRGQILQRLHLINYIAKYEKQRKHDKSLIHFYMSFFIIHIALTLICGVHMAVCIKARQDYGWKFVSTTLLTTAILMTCMTVCEFFLKRRLNRLDHRYIDLSFPIKTIPVTLEDTTCAICFEKMSEEEKSMGHLASGKIAHLFHEACAMKWQKLCLESHDPKCPMCNKAVVLAPIFKVYQASERLVSSQARL